MKQSSIDGILKVIERKAILIRSSLQIDADDCFDCENITSLIPTLTIIHTKFNDIDGLIYKLNTSTSIIAINSNRTKGQMNSILGHELYHYYFSSSGTCICKTDEFIKKNNDEEFFADCFSGMILASQEAISKFLKVNCDGLINKKTIVMMEYYFKMSRMSLLHRLAYLNYITNDQINSFIDIDDNIITEAGLPIDFFNKTLSNTATYGYYHKALHSLFEQGKIGESRYEILLNDADLSWCMMCDKKKEIIFIDTDFLSSFLKTKNANFLSDQLQNYKVMVPHEVVKEINNYYKKDSPLLFGYNSLLSNGFIVELDELKTEESDKYSFFLKITSIGYQKDKLRLRSVGDGEGEAITRAYFDGGIIASNNLKDIKEYCDFFGLEYLTSYNLMTIAYENNTASLSDLDKIWQEMSEVGVKMPHYNSFTEFYEKEKK